MTDKTEKSDTQYGALPEDWDAFIPLVLEDLRPVVMNPHALMREKTEDGTHRFVQAGDRFSKMPSLKTNGYVHGMAGWTTFNASMSDVERWREDPDMGFGVVGRTFKGIDLDIDDPTLSDAVDDFICDFFGADLPCRYREGSARKLLIFRLDAPEQNRRKESFILKQTSHVTLPKPPMIEFLFDNSFMVLAGRHKSGQRQRWIEYPTQDTIPVLPVSRVAELINAVKAEFGLSSEPYVDRFSTRPSASASASAPSGAVSGSSDPIAEYILASGWYAGEMTHDGALCVRCPWEETHSNYGMMNRKANETVYFPAGVNGVTRPGFKCLHTAHGEKTLEDFLTAIGYVREQFEVITPEAAPVMPDIPVSPKEELLPKLEMSGKKIAASAMNYDLVLRSGIFGVTYHEDVFTGQQIVRMKNGDVRPMTDRDIYDARLWFESMGFASKQTNSVKEALLYRAACDTINSAKDVIETLEWDGTPRIANLVSVLKTDDTEYAYALMEYLMTAMAGRVLQPGVKADMVPLLIGKEGVRKSTFVRLLALDPDWYVDMRITDGERMARGLRGKVLVELGEMRGYSAKQENELKAFISATRDEYNVKYKEMLARRNRTNIFIGTTNYRKVLEGRTGDRRWLPLEVGKRGVIDTDYIERNCDQLWAEAVALFRKNGVMWERVAGMGHKERTKFRAVSIEETKIRTYLAGIGFSPDDEITVDRLLIQCFNEKQPSSTIVEQTLENLGLVENPDKPGHYTLNLY